jgi:hypothetical protein
MNKKYAMQFVASVQWKFKPCYEGSDEIKLPEEVASKLNDEQKTVVLGVLKTVREESNRRLTDLSTELQNLGKKAKLTEAERQQLDDRVRQLSEQGMSAKQIHERQLLDLQTQHGETVKTVEGERDSWRNRYTQTAISSSISAAASANKAYNSDQLQAILGPRTQLVEELQEGKPTGKLIPRVKFDDVGSDGKPVQLDLSVPDAVKRMAGMDSFANLFEHSGVGGTGAQRRARSGSATLTDLKKDPAAYRQFRRQGRK